MEEFLETCLPPSPTKSPTSPTSASFRPSDPPTIAPVVATTEPTEAPLLDIPDTAAEYGFTTFVALLSAPGSDGPPLVDAVTFPPFAGPFTGFAPTNAAFDLLVEREGQELLDCLLLPRYENERYEVLSYHFADLVWKTQDFVDNQILDMKNGDISLITIEENTDINDAAIEQANLMASNEVLHGINRVLFPPGTYIYIYIYCSFPVL